MATPLTAQEIAHKVTEIHQKLENEGQKGSADWRLARGLEEAFGSNQVITEQHHESAAYLLRKYGK
ncbi:hypothetical protein NU688_33250 [Variovorax sp. ZS18.2.2]|uniref:hypothetical protein n=1 Tax=Variovorax sp. ZS18.2.2 TaxID=2971255 RepID=UPI0021512233|nr:hypothetical protein [Variovorax sp. ZS18.2.2]MCR6481066.1 hypothetical protein [Variovorax sp. ZS18.2.2]